MLADPRPLLDAFAQIPDPRCARGRRYSLASVLALATAAMLCGYRSYSAIAEWGRNYGVVLAEALGFATGTTPCAATLNGLFRRLERAEVEAALTAWAEAVVAESPLPEGAIEAVALDGKTLRGSRKQGAIDAHLLSALSHRLGLTLRQQAIDDKTNEIRAAPEVLRALVLEGRVFTMDAMLTQRVIAEQITSEGGEYVMLVKENQPSLLDDIVVTFERPHWLLGVQPCAETVDLGHGRIEHRAITTSPVMAGYSTWPGLQQVFRLERTREAKNTGTREHEVVFGVTSLTAHEAGPEALLQLVRQHWHIENRSHWVRDVTFDEDRSQVRVGSIPHVMAALRNTAIGLMRTAGATNIAAACRRFAAQPWQALALLGIYPRTE